MPITPVVKKLIIANVVIWFVGIVLIEQYFLADPKISHWFGLTPYNVLKDFYLWQPVTYLFIHSSGPMHVIFNMLLLWWMGSELERHWGARFFTLYYFVCGVGSAFLYMFSVLIYSIISGKAEVLSVPVVGASAAIFGLLVAYGLVFGERTVLFFFFFPMKAKVFVAILGAIEVVLVLNNGLIQGKVANLAHIGGLVSGFAFLVLWPWFKNRGTRSKASKKGTGKLKLVVNKNEDLNENDKPKYWN